MDDIDIRLEDSPSEEEKQFIIDQLVYFNETQAIPENNCTLSLIARSEGNPIGGLLGYTTWNWLFVKQLWVAEEFRGGGLGSSLMLAAEEQAQQRGCLHAHCDTFDFQALPFYEKLGYSIFGTLEDCPPGHTRYFLQKRDLPSAAQSA